MEKPDLFARREFVVSSSVMASGLLLAFIGKKTDAKHVLKNNEESPQPLTWNSAEDQTTNKQVEKSGKDQWRAKVKTILGNPVVMVDVTVTRTIMLDAEVYDRFSRLLRTGAVNGEPTSNDEPSGLTEVVNFYELARGLPANSRSYVVVPWTEADEGKIGLKPFAEIVKFLETKAYWRVEGSPETGFVGIFNLGAQDHRFDLSETGLPAFKSNVIAQKAVIQQAYDDRLISKPEKDSIDDLCANMLTSAYACEQALKGWAELIKVREAEQRRQREKQQKDKLREMDNKVDRVIGDFPRGWGGSFRNIA